LLRLDNLIKESTVDGGCWNVRRVATVGPHLVDEVARSLVMLLKDRGIARKALRANEIGVDSTRVIRADGNMISGGLLSRSEVLECPLNVDVALGPSDNGHLLTSDASDVVDGVRSILGVDLGIIQKISRNVEPNRVGVA
jgi:hypothetical protein